ncbi:hypothetical protein CHELA40_14602 [Chelatococcus asaccharovorans]|nr:hypothetical protein CHELA17_61018 [Chelatococcus asaccharovorans]CAH1678679.1 hypothetical protein CHELA40_14602 [Chelatococcus asaccharovorans]
MIRYDLSASPSVADWLQSTIDRSFNDLVVRLRHLHPPDSTLGANVGVKKTTSKLLVLVELLNLTFDLEHDVRRDSNVKFAPLDGFR